MRLRRRPSEQEQLLLDSELFDEQWYGAQAGIAGDRLEAVRHYLANGVPAGLSPHPLFEPGYVRRRLGPKRRARLGDGDPLTFFLRRGLRLPTHPLLAPAAAGLVEGDLAAWVRQRYAAWPTRPDRPTRADVAVSILLTCTAAPERALEAVLAAVATTGEQAEIVVVDATAKAADGSTLDALLSLPSVRIVRGEAEPLGERVVLLHDDAVPWPGWLEPLEAALDVPSVLAASPLLVGRSGAIESAGAAFPVTGGLPHRLLHDFPVEDAEAVGAIRFSALIGGAIAVRREDLRAVGGCGEPDELAEVDLCLRLAQHRPGRFRVVTESRVRHDLHEVDVEARRRFRSDWPAVAGDDNRLWAACGFRVLDREIRGELGERPLCVPEPVLARESRLTVVESPRPLRWAIKNPAPSVPNERWGDTHFAHALARALRAEGHVVVVDHHGAWERSTARHDDVALVLRGPRPFSPTPEQVSIGWVISHPETMTREEAASYDVLLAASVPWSQARSAEWDLPVRPLLQATDPELFHPGRGVPDTGADVLFVGSSRGEYRPIVRDALDADLPLTVYGANWDGIIPPQHVAAAYLDNAEVGAAYASAGIVLNDHFEDMRREGFLSNRLFDAVAAGARVVSDDVQGLGGLFGDAVQVYRDPEDLRRLCDPSTWEERFGPPERRVVNARRVGQEHSFTARARVLIDLAHEARRRRHFAG